MEKLLLISIIIPFILTVFIIPYWIRKSRQIGLVWDDMNKLTSKRIAGSGGIVVIFGFIMGVFTYIALKTFYFNSSDNLIEILATLITIFFIGGVGFIDDIFGWQRGGLSKKSRMILVLFAAIPLIVINAGTSIITIPFFNQINIGILYPLILIPLGIVGASTTFNFLAGYNGLEAGQGILILSALAVFSLITGTSWLSIIALCMVSSLAAFLIFNKYPAKIFPGDSLTYSIGALIAIMAILGNYEQFAVFIFIPYITEVILKSRGKLKKQSFGKPMEDGSIKNKYKRIYGLEHLAIRILEKIKKNKKVYEVDVVFFIYFIQILFILIGFGIFL